MGIFGYDEREGIGCVFFLHRSIRDLGFIVVFTGAGGSGTSSRGKGRFVLRAGVHACRLSAFLSCSI